ncbi:MAG: transglutaminase family protein [Phycisphaeraceae bacterium]|nr:transglutaminase family protein [Phycisphaeraceae bacterium]
MQVTVEHEMIYRYPRAVRLQPTCLQLTPRTGPDQRLDDHRLTVDPVPVTRTVGLGPAGDPAIWICFEGETDRLSISVNSVVSTHRPNPFDFLVADPNYVSVPVEQVAPAPGLAAYLDPTPAAPAVDALAAEADAETQGQTIQFLSALADRIHHTIKYLERPEGDPWPPHETMSRGEGSCRDTAWLMMAAVRSRGLPARFVSGYSLDHPPDTDPQLHAWVEVYLPGGGWRGFDPSQGLAVTDRHVALASGPRPADAAVLTGSYQGGSDEATLEYRVSVTTGDLP